MTQFKSIQLAIDLATRQRDALAQKHAQTLRQLEFARGQLQQLQGYSDETDARWLQGGAGTVSTELIRNHYQFTDRLQQAVKLQEGVITRQLTQVEAAHQALLQGEFRLAGLQQVLKSRQQAHQIVLQRREQRATDEFAANRHFQKSVERFNGETL